MAEEVGGFFVGLKAITDEGSFRKGIGHISQMKDGLAGLIKTGLGIVGVTLGLKELINAASQQGQMLMTAKYVDMTASALEAWNGVMAEAGGSADALINSLGELNAAFVNMKSSGMSPSNQLFQDLAQLGLSPEKLMGENSDQRAKDMLNAAMKSKDQAMAMQILRRNLGGMQGGLQAMLYAETTGQTIDQMYANARGRGGFNQNRLGGEEGVADLRKLGDEFKNIFGAFASTIMKDLKPSLDSLLSWLGEHKGDIKNLIDGMSKLTAAMLKFMGGALASFFDPKFQDPTLKDHPVRQGIVSAGGQGILALNEGIIRLFAGEAASQSYKLWAESEVAKRKSALELKMTIEDNRKVGVSVNPTGGGMGHAIYAGGLVYQMR